MINHDITNLSKKLQTMKQKRRLPSAFFFLLLFTLLQLTALAQQITRGTIRNASGEPVPGVTITVKGTNRSVITDANGRFSIDAPAGATLVVTSVGFSSREVTVTG